MEGLGTVIKAVGRHQQWFVAATEHVQSSRCTTHNACRSVLQLIDVPGSLLPTACAVRVSCAAMLRASMVWLATARLSASRLEASHSWKDTCRQHNRHTRSLASG
jgi:hypothetical protein